MIVQQRPWTQAKPGIKVAASMKLFRGGGEPWNEDNMGRITSLLEVQPKSVSLSIYYIRFYPLIFGVANLKFC